MVEAVLLPASTEALVVEAFIAELNHVERHMRQCLHDHPQQLGLCTTTLGPNTQEAVSFNRALDGIAPLRDDLQARLR